MNVLFPILPNLEGNIDGKWSSWSEWTKCSATCKDGKQSRFRVCNSPPPSGEGKNCSGPATETRNCNIKKCDRNNVSHILIYNFVLMSILNIYHHSNKFDLKNFICFINDVEGDCCNTDNGRLDSNRHTCFDYQSSSDCGQYDDDDFESSSLCCKCGGGKACDGKF